MTETNTGVNSHILLMVDRDANWVHWFRANITGAALANSSGSTAGNNQGFVTHYNDGGTDRKYYGPQPPPNTDTHDYDILVFRIDQSSVTLTGYADYNAMTNLYAELNIIYSDTNGNISNVSIGGTMVKTLSKGKITGTATYTAPPAGSGMTVITVTSSDLTSGSFAPDQYLNENIYDETDGASNNSPQLTWTDDNPKVSSLFSLYWIVLTITMSIGSG